LLAVGLAGAFKRSEILLKFGSVPVPLVQRDCGVLQLESHSALKEINGWAVWRKNDLLIFEGEAIKGLSLLQQKAE